MAGREAGVGAGRAAGSAGVALVVCAVAPVALGTGPQALAVVQEQRLSAHRVAGGAVVGAELAGEAGQVAEQAQVTGAILVLPLETSQGASLGAVLQEVRLGDVVLGAGQALVESRAFAGRTALSTNHAGEVGDQLVIPSTALNKALAPVQVVGHSVDALAPTTSRIVRTRSAARRTTVAPVV